MPKWNCNTKEKKLTLKANLSPGERF